MPPSKSTSKLAASLGANANAAVAKHASDETTYGFIELPGGITQGIAHLKKFYFAQYKSGELKDKWYMRAQGQVVEPVTFATNNGVIRTKGLMTSIQIPLVEQVLKSGKRMGETITIDDRVAAILLEMRRLGGEDFTEGVDTIADMEALAPVLEELKPFFIFSTSESQSADKKKTYINHQWHGTKMLPADYEPPTESGEEGGMVESSVPSQTEEQKSAALNKTMNAAEKSASVKPKMNGKPNNNPVHSTKPGPMKSAPVEPELEPEAEVDQDDLDALVADADSDSETSADSQQRLVDLAMEAGIDENAARAADTWEALKDAIIAAREGTIEDQGQDELDADKQQEWEPAKDEEYMFQPLDPKTKKKTKAVKCKVTMVDEDAKTVVLKNGKATFTKVAWSDLQPVE